MTTPREAATVGNLNTEISEQNDRVQSDNTSKVVHESTKAHPVDHGWAWAVMIGSFGVHFLSFGYIRSFGILFLEFQARFEASSAVTAVVVGVQFCVYSVSTFLVVNVVLKRFSVRQSCLVGCCLQSLGIFLNGIVPDITYLFFTQGVLFGTGLAMLYCPALIIISEYFNTKRAISTAIAASGVSAGGVTLPFLMRYFVENYGLRGGLLLLAAVMFNQVVFVSLFTPPSQYTFVASDKLNKDSGKRDNKTTEDSIKESELFSTSEKDVSNKRQFDGKLSLQDSNSCKNDEESSALLEKCKSGQFDDDEESIRLLEHYQNGLQKSKQPLGFGEMVLPSDRNTKDELNGAERKDGGERRCVHHDINTSVLDQKLDENVEWSSQVDSSPSHPHNLSQSKPGLSHQNGSNQNSEPEYSLLSEDTSLFQRDPLQTHSLKDSMLQVLSTSGADLYGSLHDVNNIKIPPFVSNQSTLHPSITKVGDDEEDNWKTRWRCRLPSVTRTLSFWVLLVFFACGGIGSGLPTIFLPPLAKEKDMNDKASFLLMMSAVTEVVGRLLPGVILHLGYMGPCTILIFPLAACGTLYQFTALYNDFSTLLTMALLIGLFTGSFWTMQSLVVIDMYGLERLGPLLGFYVLIVGLSLGVSNPFSGFLRDVSGSYSLTFHFFGTMYYLSALMMVIVLVLKRVSSKKSVDVARNIEDIPLKSSLDTV